MAVNLKSLIQSGKDLKSTLKYVPPSYNVIRAVSVYNFDDQDKYFNWKEVSLRFLQMYYPVEAVRFLSIPKI